MKKNFFKIFLVVLGSLAFVVLLLLMLNSAVTSCDKEDTYNNQTSTCSYTYIPPEPCKYKGFVDAGVCNYTPQGFINKLMGSMVLWITLGFLAVLGLGVTIYYFLSKQKKIEPLLKVISVDTAIKLHRKRWAEKYGMPMVNDEPLEYNFVDMAQDHFIVKTGESFVRYETLIQNCAVPWANDVWTFILPLSRGEEAITGGDVSTDRIDFHRYHRKFSMWPLYNIQNPRERMIQQLFERAEPEVVSKYLNEVSPSITQNQQTPEVPEMEEGQENMSEIPYQPSYRRPTRRYRRISPYRRV